MLANGNPLGQVSKTDVFFLNTEMEDESEHCVQYSFCVYQKGKDSEKH